MILIGIDPGKQTGLAAMRDGKFTDIRTLNIIAAMRACLSHVTPDEELHIYIEDARLRKWFGNSGREKLQGAGSIKRDSAIWQEFCEYYCIKYTLISPLQKGAKMNAKLFKKVTGWQGLASEHSRDAAALIVGRK